MRVWIDGVRDVWQEVGAPTTFLVWLLISFVVAVSGPFGTFESEPLEWRAAYWCSVIWIAIVTAISLRVFWRSVLKGRPSWQEDLATTGSLALTFGPFLVLFNSWLDEPSVHYVIGFGPMIAIVFAVSVCTVVMRRVLHNSGPRQSQPRDRLLDRIAAPEGVRLARVSSDNHHINITTNDGKDYRILMRLRDAVGEIDVEDGFCIHRSHWVARSQIAEVTFADGREIVKMPCGSVVPVGPKYRTNLITAGVVSA